MDIIERRNSVIREDGFNWKELNNYFTFLSNGIF